MISIIDIDGTLSDFTHRVHLIDKENPTPEDFKKFLHPDLILQDTTQRNSEKGLAQVVAFSRYVCFVTGRNEYLRNPTIAWLREHYPFIKEVHLRMRPDGELTVATDHKKRILDKYVVPYLKHEHNESMLLIDDDPYVLEVYSQYGIALRAPECWDSLIHNKPATKEPLFTK